VVIGIVGCEDPAKLVGSPQTGRHPVDGEEPTNSGCLNESAKGSDPQTCEESLDLTWDGASLLVEHWCYSASCVQRFAPRWEVEAGTLLLHERDAEKERTACDCVQDLSWRASPDPGDYAFRLDFQTWDEDADVWRSTPRYAGDVSLPDGEERAYHF
jgi:hypothetical protein